MVSREEGHITPKIPIKSIALFPTTMSLYTIKYIPLFPTNSPVRFGNCGLLGASFLDLEFGLRRWRLRDLQFYSVGSFRV